MITFLINAIKIIFLLGFLVLIHEGGHFVIAKLCKVRVNEFAIGFGKKIYSKKIGETVYELRLIPLGGFVSMEGEEHHSDNEGSFNLASYPKKIAIVMAGGLTNIIFGLILYYFLIAYISDFQSAYSSLIKFIELTLENLKNIFTGHIVKEQLIGPVGISAMIAKTGDLLNYLYLLSVISLSLGVTNLLPFPPLDGGKVLIYLIEWITKKEIKENIQLKIQSIGFTLIILLSIYVMYSDIIKLF